jgi:hypothetical protein
VPRAEAYRRYSVSKEYREHERTRTADYRAPIRAIDFLNAEAARARPGGADSAR